MLIIFWTYAAIAPELVPFRQRPSSTSVHPRPQGQGNRPHVPIALRLCRDVEIPKSRPVLGQSLFRVISLCSVLATHEMRPGCRTLFSTTWHTFPLLHLLQAMSRIHPFDFHHKSVLLICHRVLASATFHSSMFSCLLTVRSISPAVGGVNPMNFKTCSNTKTTFFRDYLKTKLETKFRTKKSLFVGHADRQTLSHCSEQAFVHGSLS